MKTTTVHRRVLLWFWDIPGVVWVPITLTGRWKIEVINNISTLYVETTRKEERCFRKPKEITEWVDEANIRIEEREEFINTCGETNG